MIYPLCLNIAMFARFYKPISHQLLPSPMPPTLGNIKTSGRH
jgi:hypothetical protein